MAVKNFATTFTFFLWDRCFWRCFFVLFGSRFLTCDTVPLSFFRAPAKHLRVGRGSNLTEQKQDLFVCSFLLFSFSLAPLGNLGYLAVISWPVSPPRSETRRSPASPAPPPNRYEQKRKLPTHGEHTGPVITLTQAPPTTKRTSQPKNLGTRPPRANTTRTPPPPHPPHMNGGNKQAKLQLQAPTPPLGEQNKTWDKYHTLK